MGRIHRRFMLPLAALLLTGCALLPDEGRRADTMAMPDPGQALKADPDAEKIVRAWPNAHWWRDFHNAELNRLLETALRDSPTLRAAFARVNQAEAGADYRAADMLPSVGARADFHHRRFSATDFYGPTGGHTLTGAYIDPLAFSYHLDLWGKDRAALESALGHEKAQVAELAMARLLLGVSIAKLYFRLCSTEDEIELAAALTAKADEQLQLSRRRWQGGLATEDAVHAAEQTLQAANQRQVHRQTEAQHLRNRLAMLAGRGPDWGRGIKVEAVDVAERFPLPENLPLGLLAHRPDVTAALWRVQAAAQSVKVAQTNFYPDVNLVGFAGLRSLNLKDLFLSHGASVAYSIGPTVSLPIFEGGRLEAELKNEQAGYDLAVEAYNGALLGAVQQVADALAAWRESVADDAAQERAVHAAQSEADVAAKRFHAGIGPRDGDIDAQRLLLEQRLKSSELRAAHLQAAVGLIEALGGGYQNKTTALLGEQR